LHELSAEAHANAETVCSSLDRTGYVAYRDLVPVELVLEGYHPIVARCWVVLKPFVEAVREDRPQRNYQKYFEYLAQETFKRYMSEEEATQWLYLDTAPATSVDTG